MATEKKTLSQIINEFASMEITDAMDDTLKGKINQAKVLTAFAVSHNNIPMSVLVYVAVGTNACKPHTFENGYCNNNGTLKGIDVDKAEKVFAFAKLVADKFGERYYSNDKVVHFLCTYVVKGGTKVALKNALNNVSPIFNIAKAKTAKEIGKALFGETADFTEGGYFNGIKATPKKAKKQAEPTTTIVEEIIPNGYKKDKNGNWRDSKGHFVKAPTTMSVEDKIASIF